MNMDDYQKAAINTAIYPPEVGLTYTALGLAGEAGEICNKVKKVLRDNNGELSDERRQQLFDEVSDVLWYVATFTNELGFSMSDVAIHNVQKLLSRQKRGKLGGDGDTR